MRGELVKDARPGRARNALIGVQVFASALLLIAAAIFLRSAIASSRFDPGLRTADTVLLDTRQRAQACRHAPGDRRRDPPLPRTPASGHPSLAMPLPAFADTGAGKTPTVLQVRHRAAYFDVLGVPIVRGRTFTAAEVDEHPVVIVSESTARALWPNGDGIGETFRLEPDLTAQAERQRIPRGQSRRAADR